MEDNSTILLDVNMDDLINSLRELKKQYDENTAAMKALKKAGEEDSDEYIRLAQDNKVLQQSMRGVEKQIQNEIKAERAQDKSLIQLRAQLANLQKQYDSMSGVQRMSAAGAELQQRIKGLSDEVLGLEGNTGRWQRNVGNYQSALQGLAGSFNVAGINAGGLRKAIASLQSGNPVIVGITAAVAGLTAAIKRMTTEFKENEKAQMEMRETMADTELYTIANKRVWNDFADWFNGKWRQTVQTITALNYNLLQSFDKFMELFGGSGGRAENFARGTLVMRQYEKANNDLIKKEREWTVERAKIDKEVASLRAKASDRETYDAQQRLAFLDQAQALENKKYKTEQKIAEARFKLQKFSASLSENSAEQNDKLAQSEAAVYTAQKEAEDTTRRLNRERRQAVNEIKGQTSDNKKLAGSIKEVRDKIEEIQMLSVDEAIKEATKGNKALADSIGEVADRLGILKKETDLMDADKFADFTAEFSDTVADAPSKLEEMAAAFANNAKNIEETAQGLGDSFGSLSDIYKTLAEDETKSEEERAEAARKAQMWAKLQIAANSGTAVAKGVAAAMDQPFPANLGAIATTLAAVLSAIAQAKALAAESHYTGGPVGNRFTGATMGPDNTVINARRGELVINAEQQRRLYDIANGGTPTSLAASLASALRSMPSPTLVYSEFAGFRDNIINLDESQKIK